MAVGAPDDDGAGPPGLARGVTALPIWATIVPELAAKVRPMAKVMIHDVIEAVREAVPAYRRPLAGKFREVLVGGVEMAVMQCFRFIEDPRAPRDQWLSMFRYLGRVEFQEGRTTDALQTAVRVGARSVWRHISRAGQEAGISADTLLTAAEAIFAYVDDICVVAVAGYTEAQARTSGSHERRRRQLLTLLLADPPPPPRAVADLAAAVGWRLPSEVAVVVLEHRPDQHHLPVPALAREVLVDLESAEPCLLVPEPAAHPPLPAEALGGRRAAVGPTVALGDAHRSRRLARRALTLVRRGVLPDVGLTHCDRHLATLLVHADETLVSHVAEPVRAAFAELTDKQRERAARTLRAWLRTRGDINETAALLAVHPQTVRYRMNQVEELLGARLADPEQRFLMEIAADSWQVPPPAGPSPEDRASAPAATAVTVAG